MQTRSLAAYGGAARALYLRCSFSLFLDKHPSAELLNLGASYWAFAAALVLTLAFAAAPDILRKWALAELLFVAVSVARYFWLDRGEEAKGQGRGAYDAFRKFLQSVSKLDKSDVRRQTEDWFFGLPCEQLSEEDVENLVAYGFCGNESHFPGNDLVKQMTTEFSRVLDLPLRSRNKPRAKFRAHLWEKLRAFHFPLVFYIFSEALGFLSHTILILMGFNKSRCMGSAYFLHQPETSDLQLKKKQPIVFLHGIGIGLLPYLPFIQRLMLLGHPVLLVENRHVCMRLCFASCKVDDRAEVLKAILDKLSFRDCMLLSHSFGTLEASRFLRSYPMHIGGMCLIDPVCCAMHNPKLLMNFVYRGVDVHGLHPLLSSLLLLCVSREPSISASVSRAFQWTNLNLWPELMPSNSLLVLSEQDELVPVTDVKRLFANTGATVLAHPMHAHGHFITDVKWQERVLKHVSEMLQS